MAEFGTALFERYAPGVDVGEMISQQAPKRVGLRVHADTHRHLGPPQAGRHLLRA